MTGLVGAGYDEQKSVSEFCKTREEGKRKFYLFINASEIGFHTERTSGGFRFEVSRSWFGTFDLNETFGTDGLIATSRMNHIRWIITN